MNFKRYSLIGIAVVAVLGLIVASRSFVWVNPGNVGIVTQFGDVDMVPLTPGPSFINPLKSVVNQPTRLIAHKSKASAATSKGQAAPAEITVTYSIDAAQWPLVYSRIGGISAINAAVIDSNVQQSLKQVTGNFLAEELIQQRVEVKHRVVTALNAAINKVLAEKGLVGAIRIGSIAITDFDFSKEFNDGIDAKVEAEQRALQAESEAQQKQTLALANAEAQRKLADANAYATEKLSVARAEGIRLKAEALREGAGLLELKKAEKWDGEVPEYFGGGTLPFINVDPQKTK